MVFNYVKSICIERLSSTINKGVFFFVHDARWEKRRRGELTHFCTQHLDLITDKKYLQALLVKPSLWKLASLSLAPLMEAVCT